MTKITFSPSTLREYMVRDSLNHSLAPNEARSLDFGTKTGVKNIMRKLKLKNIYI